MSFVLSSFFPPPLFHTECGASRAKSPVKCMVSQVLQYIICSKCVLSELMELTERQTKSIHPSWLCASPCRSFCRNPCLITKKTKITLELTPGKSLFFYQAYSFVHIGAHQPTWITPSCMNSEITLIL